MPAVTIPHMPRTPDITVAAIAQTAGRFLFVEERINNRLVFNQPAGHVEQGESLLAAVVREVREETAWRFEPQGLLGVYLWRRPSAPARRCALPSPAAVRDPRRTRSRLDRGIVRTHWLSESRSSRLASPPACAARWSCAVSRTFPRRRHHHAASTPSAQRDPRDRGRQGRPRPPACKGRVPALASAVPRPAVELCPASACRSSPATCPCCPPGARVIVGLSGGVDSAVAALLLKESGWEVHGLFMSNWEEDDGYCTAAQDYQDARAVAAQLGIPLHRASFAREYRERVFAHFLAEHSAGRTPNPDILCNREIKFGVGLRCMHGASARTHFATGHYARLASDAADGTGALQGASMPAKDQSLLPHGRGASSRGGSRARCPAARRAAYMRPRCASARGARACRSMTSPTAPGSASSASARSASFWRAICARSRPSRHRVPDGENLGDSTRDWPSTPSARRNGPRASAAAPGPWPGGSPGTWRPSDARSATVLIVVQGHDHPLLASRALLPTAGPLALAEHPAPRAVQCRR